MNVGTPKRAPKFAVETISGPADCPAARCLRRMQQEQA
jgi:hypothetical protein